MKRIGYALFQTFVVATQVISVTIAIYDGKSVLSALAPSIAIALLYLAVWITGKWDIIDRTYKRLPILPGLLRAHSFVLIIKPKEIKTNLCIRTNYAEVSDVVSLLAYTTIELNNSEESIDSLTNELGIKRADEE